MSSSEPCVQRSRIKKLSSWKVYSAWGWITEDRRRVGEALVGLVQHAKFPDIVRFDDFDRDAMRLIVVIFVIVIVVIIIASELGCDDFGCKDRPESTFAELLVYAETLVSELQRECLSMVQRKGRWPSTVFE
jgi:hypothetical protein